MKWLGRTSNCPHCGAELPKGSLFCPSCGKGVGGGEVRCGSCGASLPSDARFCSECGEALNDWREPVVDHHRWKRSPDHFATRIDVEDVPGLLRKRLVVEPGTQAILLSEGRNLGVVGPGTYTMETLLGKITGLGSVQQMSVILVDAGDVDLEMTIPDLFTSDPLKIQMDCLVTVALRDPLAFFINVMRGRRSYSLTMLRNFLFGEIQNAAAECVAEHSIAELGTNLALKEEFATYIAEHLNRTLERSGLALAGVRTLNYVHQRWDEIRETVEDYLLQATKEEAEVRGQRRLLDVWNEQQLLEISREETEAMHHERRAAVKERMRRMVLSEQMAEVRDLQEMEKFLRGVDRDNLIRDNEWEELRRDLRERWEDHEAGRAHLGAKLAVERDYERRLAELGMRRELSTQELEMEQNLAKRRMQGEMEIEEQRWLFELRRRQHEAEARREQQRLDDLARRQGELEEAAKNNQTRLGEAKTQADIDAIEREQDRLDVELGLVTLERMKAIQRRDEEEQKRIVLAAQAQELEMTLRAEKERLEMRLSEQKEAHAFELQRLEALSQVSVEMLVSASPPDQARLLVELKRTEVLGGMSEEQILALAAEESPEIAEAFKERFRAMGGPEAQVEVKELYEQMLVEQKAASGQLSEAQERHAQRLQEMFEKALDSQRDSITPFARGGGRDPVVVVSGSGQVVRAGEKEAAEDKEVVLCRRCHTKVPVGTRYCHNCGEEQF